VLSTEIYFAVVGAQLDYGRAAALAILLLAMALGAFFLQRHVVGSGSYATISGKGDAGLPTPLPRAARRLAEWIALPWAVFTLLLYGFAFVGGLVKVWGPRLHADPRSLRQGLRHRALRRRPDLVGRGVELVLDHGDPAAIAAPLTALLGLLAAWLLVRQRFAGRMALEFATMLSFAVPGTVIGVAYVFAFNVPPIEITGTAMIIVLCFVFRNMPVGVRAGMAADEPDRPQPRRGLAHPARARPADPGSMSCCRCCGRRGRRPGLRLRARRDDGERRGVPGHREYELATDLHHPARDQRRLRPRHRL
jgi:iron(III) transport system permease protein